MASVVDGHLWDGFSRLGGVMAVEGGAYDRSDTTCYCKSPTTGLVRRRDLLFVSLVSPIGLHCKKYPYNHRYLVTSLPHFNGTAVSYAFVSVNRRNNEARTHIVQTRTVSLKRGKLATAKCP